MNQSNFRMQSDNNIGEDPFSVDHVLQSMFRSAGFGNQGFDQGFSDFHGEMFNPFSGLSDGFRWDQNMFANNFQQQFRSSDRANGGGFFDDLIRMTQERSFSDQGQNRKPADRKVVDRLPIIKISAEHCKKLDNGKLEAPVCPICTEELSIGKEALFLPCGHIYDNDCLMPWLKDHNTCPVCRFELPVQR